MADAQLPATRLRNARACEACRASKSRCIYKAATEVCQRCLQNGTQCIVREKARPMRTRGSRVSVPGHSQEERGYVLELPSISSKASSQDLEDIQSHHRAALDPDGVDREEGGELSSLSTAPTIIKARRVTLQQAEKLVSRYRSLMCSLPFFKLPETATVQSLSRSSPFLLLSILTVASKNDADLHAQMDHEFRRVLSQKLVVEGTKTLDFLQGLLVYISWAPMPTNQRTSPLFTYLNLAISLTNELGLDTEYPNPSRFMPVDPTGLITDGEFTVEAKQAYLGCYYISAITALSNQRPNGFQYSTLLELRGMELLADDPSCESYYLIKLTIFWARLTESYAVASHRDGARQFQHNEEMTLQMLLNEFQEYKRTTPNSIREKSFVALQEKFTNHLIYAYHLGLGFLRIANLKAPQYQCRPENILHDFQCLEASKMLFDFLLSMPEENFLIFTNTHWTFIAMSFVILSRLTFAMAADMGWDSNAARTNVPMVMYLDCLCWRFQSLCSRTGGSEKSCNFFDTIFVIQKVMETLKKTYSLRVSRIQPQAIPLVADSTPSSRGHCPMKDADLNDFFDSHSSHSGNSETQSQGQSQAESTSSSNVPVYFDIWSTMTGSWAGPDGTGFEGWTAETMDTDDQSALEFTANRDVGI